MGAEYVKCNRPWTGFELYDHLGDVRPCCWGKISCGNINNQPKEEIWNGKQFEFYREMMLAGETEKICGDNCPIINGKYKEKYEAQPTPIYMRIVPSIKCNLRCKFCYQLNSPPPLLPDDLLQQFLPWLKEARELLILGGETFIAKECIEWIRRITPDEFPQLKLAAITNGLGFSEAICQLISERQWNWVLVSIDAASADGFRKIRGGDFSQLLSGLSRLCASRSKMENPFELRFGFTIQNSNIGEAIKFIDFCNEYRALPQFTLVSGSHHGERPQTYQEVKRIYEGLELLDKYLFLKGFGNNQLSHIFTELQKITFASTIVKPALKTIYYNNIQSFNKLKQKILTDHGQHYPVLLKPFHGTDNMVNSNKMKKAVLFDLDGSVSTAVVFQLDGRHNEEAIDDYIKLFFSAPIPSDRFVVFIVDSLFKIWAKSIFNVLETSILSSYSISIPYFDNDETLSCLNFVGLVEELKEIARRRGWRWIGGYQLLENLGIRLNDHFPKIKEVLQFGTPYDAKQSVISAIYNQEYNINKFLQSAVKTLEAGFHELILVNDGSSDATRVKIEELLTANTTNLNIKLIDLERDEPYIPGTFSFRAGPARQVGVDFSSGEHLIFIDPDQIILSDCIIEHKLGFERGFDIVIGDRFDSLIDNPSPWSSLRRESLLKRKDWWLSFFTGNSSVSRDKFIQAGGFDSSFLFWGLDDTDLAYRLSKTNIRIWHSVRSVVNHLDSKSGGGNDFKTRNESFRIHMEVMYRKYFDKEIINAFRFLWPNLK